MADRISNVKESEVTTGRQSAVQTPKGAARDKAAGRLLHQSQNASKLRRRALTSGRAGGIPPLIEST
ncbi:hypothetical protein HHA02_24960 [Cobetia marina]|nr:hypothetical protein HHA02_24960 [Cobetia marina]